MLRIALSNRYEVLRQLLLERLASPPASPFEADEVIVPSTAIKRDVELAAADRFGVCANTRFSFLAQWLWRQIARLVPVGEHSPFTPSVLAWRVHELFGDRTLVAAQPSLARYLDAADPRNRYELATRTAALLDQYVVYRPQWLEAWADGRSVEIGGKRDEDQRWQAALWRRIAADVGAGRRHPSVPYFAELEALGAVALTRAALPERVHVFAVPTMAPLHLDILRRLSRWIDVDLYVVNPSREYWFRIVDARRLSWLAARGRLDYQESGNALLASWGKQTQQFAAELFEDAGEAVEEASGYVPSAPGKLLGRVQDAILDLRELEPGSIALAPDDRSIEVHVCHSLVRELEVLHDRLLGLFAGPDPPRPSDILVVTPDLATAAPQIDAVFGTSPAPRRIPYAITGLPASRENAAAAALLLALDVATSRVTATGAFELLEQRIVARRFGLDGGDLDRLRDWMRDAGIRWGLDASHRAEFGVPAVADYTFADGLERLFLGYAVAADADVFAGRLPAGDAEGSAALALGGFRLFVQELARLHRTLAQPKTPEGWRAALNETVAAMFAPAGDELDDTRAVDAAIAALCSDMERGGARQPIAASVVRTALEAALDDPARGGVPAGAVTFSAMASLRGLPYRVVCVIGMNDNAWPSGTRPVEFDLMAREPRAGDRQRRLDERNVFLDLLLAARDCLHLSYTGFDARDNAELPPSVLVAELLDALLPALATEPSPAAARMSIVVEHFLQPFAVEAFLDAPAGDEAAQYDVDGRRRSYDTDTCDALRGAAVAYASRPVMAAAAEGESDDDADEAADPLPPFFSAPLAPAGDEWRDVPLATLARFFGNPARFLLAERLRIALPRRLEELDDDEPFVPDYEERTALADRLVPLVGAGHAVADVEARARAGREFPPGRLGALLLGRELAVVATFADTLVAATRTPLLPPATGTLAFNLDGETWRVDCAFSDLRAAGRVRYRLADIHPRDYLTGWIEHLALNALRPPGVVPHTRWLSRDGHYDLPPLPDAATAQRHLTALLRLFREGLAAPLHFYPKSAWALVRKGEPKARSAWLGSPEFGGESADPAYRLALRGVADPLDAGFVANARAVFAPLQDAIVDPRLDS